jgi:hypothetical protein
LMLKSTAVPARRSIGRVITRGSPTPLVCRKVDVVLIRGARGFTVLTAYPVP